MATVVYITSRGREIITSRLGANAATFSEPKQVGWGTANSGTASPTLPGSNQPSDIAPFSEAAENRVPGTATLATSSGGTTNDTYQVAGTITSASGQTIGESFLSTTGTTNKPQATTLAATMTNVATAMSVTSGTGFPAAPFYVQVENEVMQVTSVGGGTNWTVVRGQNGSTNVAHGTTLVGVTLGNIPGAVAQVNNGDLLLHAAYTGLALNTGDSLAATLQVKFT